VTPCLVNNTTFFMVACAHHTVDGTDVWSGASGPRPVGHGLWPWHGHPRMASVPQRSRRHGSRQRRRRWHPPAARRCAWPRPIGEGSRLPAPHCRARSAPPPLWGHPPVTVCATRPCRRRGATTTSTTTHRRRRRRRCRSCRRRCSRRRPAWAPVDHRPRWRRRPRRQHPPQAGSRRPRGVRAGSSRIAAASAPIVVRRADRLRAVRCAAACSSGAGGRCIAAHWHGGAARADWNQSAMSPFPCGGEWRR